MPNLRPVLEIVRPYREERPDAARQAKYAACKAEYIANLEKKVSGKLRIRLHVDGRAEIITEQESIEGRVAAYRATRKQEHRARAAELGIAL